MASRRMDAVARPCLRPSFETRANTWPLKTDPDCDILVGMTRISKSKLTKRPKRRVRGRRPPGHWLLQDAKARFSELVRRVRSEGPQHVTVHGRDEVVVIAAEEFRRLKGDLTGQALIAAMQASPHRDIDIEPKRAPMPVREVSL
jgi:prevent-host-death family protein